MSISGLLNTLAERALIACDASYFTNTNITGPRPPGDSDPTHLYLGDPLDLLLDSSPILNGYRPAYSYVSLTQGYVVDQEFINTLAGFKAVAFKNSATNDIVISIGGTDGTNPTDWKANLQSYGFSEWEAGKADVFTYLNGLPRNPDTGELLVTVNFTGQSLGGALAQYALYEWLEGNTDLTSRQNDASHSTLTTFNALGGVYGLEQRPSGGFNPSVLTGLSSAANFVVQGDLASRLGGGFAAGSIYQLRYSPDQINPVTGQPYSETLGLIESHRIESGFYANLQSDGFASAQLIDASSYIIPSDNLAQPAALLGNLLNAKGPFVGSDFADFLAGLSAAAAIADPVQFDRLYKAVLQSGHETGSLDDVTYTVLNGLRYPTDLVLKAIGIAATPITLLGAGLADFFDLGLTGVQKAFSGVQQFLGWGSGQVPPPPLSMSSNEYAMKMLVYLSDVPGSTPTSTALAQEFQTLNINSDVLAQHLLNTSGDTWRSDLVAFLPQQLPALADKTRMVGLTNALYATLGDIPGLSSEEHTLLAQEHEAVSNDTASGFANAFADFTQKITNVAFNLGQTISSFADVQLIDQAYAAELSDPRLSSSVRTVVEDARAIVQRAGQAVVIEKGMGPNPFNAGRKRCQEPLFELTAVS